MLFYIFTGILVAFILFGVGSMYFDRFSDGTEKFFATVFGIPIGTFLAGGFVALVLLVPASIKGTTEQEGWSVNLQAINMGESVKGRFFLGSGYVDGELTYHFYAQNPDGSFYADSVDADYATIVESNETPRIQKIESVFSDFIYPTNLLGTGLDMTQWDGLDMTQWDERYVIYVPEGSVKPMIDMDLPGSDND